MGWTTGYYNGKAILFFGIFRHSLYILCRGCQEVQTHVINPSGMVPGEGRIAHPNVFPIPCRLIIATTL